MGFHSSDMQEAPLRSSSTKIYHFPIRKEGRHKLSRSNGKQEK